MNKYEDFNEEEIAEEAVELLKDTLGAEVIAEYENKPEKYLVAAVRIDEMAFDGQWYPTAFTEEAIQEAPLELLEREIFFLVRVTTDV